MASEAVVAVVPVVVVDMAINMNDVVEVIELERRAPCPIGSWCSMGNAYKCGAGIRDVSGFTFFEIAQLRAREQADRYFEAFRYFRTGTKSKSIKK